MFDDADSPKEFPDKNLPAETVALHRLGEKVAIRPDKGAFVGGRGPKRAPHPSPLPQFFASILPSNNSLFPRKKSREREQHGAVQLGSLLKRVISQIFFFLVDEVIDIAGGFFEVVLDVFALHAFNQSIQSFDNSIDFFAADLFVLVRTCETIL
jgi:hypothetical protein